MNEPLDRQFSDEQNKVIATRALSPIWPVELTPMQKLHALGARFYFGLAWTPKADDLYTTSRPDLELYQIVSIQDGIVSTRYRDRTRAITCAEWREEDFLDPATFGYVRVHVPNWVIFDVR